MTNVWTQAGLSRREKRLLTPFSTFDSPEPPDGEGERESADEGGEYGGAGNLEFDRDLRDPSRPDSSIYGVTDDLRLPILLANCAFSSSSISTSFISSVTPSWAPIA